MSVRLKNPWHECPINGFLVTIPNLGQTEPRQFWSFGQAIAWFRDIAAANPHLGLPTDTAAIERYISQQNALRCLAIPGGDGYVIQEGGPAAATKKVFLGNLPARVAAAAVDIRRAAAGTAVVLDWLMSGGKPVEPSLAATRAEICAACPKNVSGSWFTVAPAEIIRETLSARSDVKLETPHDGKLKSCDACKCLLRLKVHCPIGHIADRMKDDEWSRFDLRCWILREAEHSPKPEAAAPGIKDD
jgi:hypothetical protein